ncbi:M14 family zinc carboxypeptidase [Marinobacter sp. C2H3]|uniref:M14 family zinc carboxypeptidase n=1 Tax=Marinobacter sp. C2H3 TaxID=3119003 RepID=UPI00300F5CE5
MTELRDLTPHAAIPAEQAGRDARQRRQLRANLPELVTLERLLAEAPESATVSVAERVSTDGLTLPVYQVTLGAAEPSAPLVLLVGGVHGLERIGTQVVTAWLSMVLHRMRWDRALQHLLGQVRVVVLPLLNPGGMYRNQRSNPNGVDLMRNAPIRAQSGSTFMLGGQRWSRHLPWYIGTPEQAMEPENQALARVIEEEVIGRPFSVALDCHSGFGWRDQIWFPYAYRRRPMRRIASVLALKLLWEQAYPNHEYRFEPQSTHYLTHGDLWDHFYKRINRGTQGAFLPLTLEMGSWRWVRKRPGQLLRLDGLFNPLVPHRTRRALRSHLNWIDFLLHAAASHDQWLPGQDQEPLLRQAALQLWYRDNA